MFELSERQTQYFRTFGFLRIKGLFREEIGRIIDGFEDVFRTVEPTMVVSWEQDALQQTEPRRSPSYRKIIHPQFIRNSDKLSWLAEDPRVMGVARALTSERTELLASDANLYYSNTSWHPDLYGAPLDVYHLKMSFYLDELRAESGAIRVIPGTHFYLSEFAKLLLEKLHRPPREIRETFGVEADEIPSYVVENDPGDVLLWDFRTFHASFHGADRRRSFALVFSDAAEK